VDVPYGTAPVETVRIDRLTGPFRWVKWTNVGLLSLAVSLPLWIISSALRGQFDVSIIVGSLILVFPGWIAWKNVNVVNSLNQRCTIRSLLLVGVPAVALALTQPPFIVGWLKASAFSRIGYLLGGIGYLLVGGSIALLAALAVWRLRRRMIDPLGVKLIDLLSVPSQRAPSRLRNVGSQRPLLGWTLIATAVIVVVGDGLMATESSGVNSITSLVAQLGFFFILMARSAFQPSAYTVLREDDRKPVLLMRSFIDDERLNWLKSEGSFVDSSLESRLTSHFAHYGPFVAVGAPSEQMPVIGAARIKLTNAEWQDQVVRWIDGSVVILMMAGVTDWVEWELKQVIAHNALGRLIICFPPLSKRKWKDKSLRKFAANMQARLDRLRRAFAETRWSAALGRLDDAKSLRSLAFGEDGRVTVVRARSRDRNAYHLQYLSRTG
jgi:hypothetical protein